MNLTESAFVKFNQLFLFLLLVFLLPGCVLKYPVSRNSRFSVDISEMKKEDFIHDTWVYRHPVKLVRDYPAFYLRSVEAFSVTVKKLTPESRERYEELARNLKIKIEKMIGSDFKLVNKPGRNVLELTVEIVDIKPVVTMKKGGNDVVVTDTTLRGSKFELDAVDSKSGELIFAISTLLKGDQYADFENPELVPVLENELIQWIKFLGDRLKEKRNKTGSKG